MTIGRIEVTDKGLLELLREAQDKLELIEGELYARYKDAEPPWLTVARGEIGVHELPGNAHTARILEYLATLTNIGGWGKSRDETHWCSAFINWCFAKVGIAGTNHGLAKSWSGNVSGVAPFGWPVYLKYALPGDIVVLENPNHVAFYLSHTAEGITCLGGNQDDSVSIKEYPRSRLYSVRRPPSP